MKSVSSDEVVVGIDPGTATLGFAFVSGTKKSPKILEYGVIHTDPLGVDKMPSRLLEIGQDLSKLINKYKPTRALVEDLFFFRNKTTIISVSQARGVILYELAKNSVAVSTATPLQVKQTLCGYGRASKSQVQMMVQKLYNLDSIPKPDDAADSLAMAWLALD